MFKKCKWFYLASLFGLLFLVSSGEGADTILNGAGATFPYPLYEKWMKVYRDETGIRVDYRAVGSGSGIRKLLGREVDFGGTDAFLSEEELERTQGDILHIPTCLGAVTVIYHLPENPLLKFTPELISDIFLGKLTNWSDERISAINPGVSFPDLKISVFIARTAVAPHSFSPIIFQNPIASGKIGWVAGKKSVGPPEWALREIPTSLNWSKKFRAVSAMWSWLTQSDIIFRWLLSRTGPGNSLRPH